MLKYAVNIVTIFMKFMNGTFYKHDLLYMVHAIYAIYIYIFLKFENVFNTYHFTPQQQTVGHDSIKVA